MSAVVRTINRVDGIFRLELSVGLQLIGNNDEIVYTDPDTDPFEGNDDSDALIEESQSVITDNIGSENFDLGHTFSTGAGGLAGTGPCDDDSKARGITGLSSPEGDKYDVDYVAHEIGHQLNMNHTFNGVGETAQIIALEVRRLSLSRLYNYGLCGELWLRRYTG